MSKAKHKPRPSAPNWYWWGSDGCYDCNRNHNGCNSCHRMKIFRRDKRDKQAKEYD